MKGNLSMKKRERAKIYQFLLFVAAVVEVVENVQNLPVLVEAPSVLLWLLRQVAYRLYRYQETTI
jgi:hypothetical protein